jgi:RimJ/RimL family protein N-acetyltransferase
MLPEDALAQVLGSSALRQTRRTHLRLVEARQADALYIHGLRADRDLNRHLSAPPPNPEAQLEWLRTYKSRERAGREFYFLIFHNGEHRGVVRMYDFTVIGGHTSFCWGSWIIPQPRPPELALASALLIYQLGFEDLRFEQSHFDVRRENLAVQDFHRKTGAREIGQAGDDVQFVYGRLDYEAFTRSNLAQYAWRRNPR